jgi:Cu+-exporting ATPase
MTMLRGATDPVCGMKVDRSKALKTEHAGQTYHFCSEHCRHGFLADPKHHAGQDAAPIKHPAPTHAH